MVCSPEPHSLPVTATTDYRVLESPSLADVSSLHTSDLQGRVVHCSMTASRKGSRKGKGREGTTNRGEQAQSGPPKGGSPAAPTLSLGGGEAHRLAPLTPLALVAFLLCNVILQSGHLDTQPGLIGGTRVHLDSFEEEPGYPNHVILVPGPLWG